MLIRCEVTNFRSVREPVELSLVAIDHDRRAARPVSNLGQSLLPVAALYGPNASGKSNILAALVWIRDAVSDSLRFWEDEIPVEPFAFSDTAAPSEFVVESVVDGIRFEYQIELDRERIHYEALFHYPERKRRRIFERDGPELKIQRGLGGISGARELLTDRTLVLSAARRFDEPLVSAFAREILEIQVVGLMNRRPRAVLTGLARPTIHWLEPARKATATTSAIDGPSAGERDRDRALALLRMADLGVEDVVIDDEEVNRRSLDGEVVSSRRRRRVRLVHRAGVDRFPLNMEAESDGTRAWYRMIGPVLHALETGSTLVCDELDGSLHPVLSSQLLRLFHDPETNPRGAQLIFSTHDTSLLDHLSRDEVWLTEKENSGATTMSALADFSSDRVRSSTDLADGYLHGRFGGLPDVDRTEVLRALGLIG